MRKITEAVGALTIVTAATVVLAVSPQASTSAAVSPMPSAPTPSRQAAPTPLLETLGEYSRSVTTDSPAAQAYFDQGLRLTFGYYFPEAVASFLEAIRHDPECGMCHWGLALAISPNPNSRRFASIIDDPRGRGRQAALAALAGRATAREKDLIGALAVRFDLDAHPDRDARDAAYIEATRELVARHPDDPEAAGMLADAIMTASPWEYWRPDGTPRPGVLEAKAALESGMAIDIDHPWANHLYIHLMENSPTPAAALASADRLEATMPGAGHMVHMPAHIYLRIGLYDRVTASNRRSLAADRELVGLWGDAALPTGVSTYGLSATTHPGHARDFLHVAALMRGNYGDALGAAETLTAGVPLEQIGPLNGGAQARFVKRWITYVRFGRWPELLAEEAPNTTLPFIAGMWDYARGSALAATGELDQASRHLGFLRAAADDPTVAELPARRNPGRDILTLAADALAGEIAARRGDVDEALARLGTAVRLEDRLQYVEPPDWLLPVRHVLGAVLLDAGRAAEAEAVYWEDLRRYPENGWALRGLVRSLRAQGKEAEAAEAEGRFRAAWEGADVTIPGSRF